MENNQLEKNIVVEEIDKNKELNSLNPKQKKAIASMLISSSFSGPIPSPQMLKAYIEINPEFGNKIFEMTEKESEHRRKCEWTLIRISSRGQKLAFIIAILVVLSGCYAIYMNNTAIGCTIFGTTIIGLVVAFLKGSFSK